MKIDVVDYLAVCLLVSVAAGCLAYLTYERWERWIRDEKSGANKMACPVCGSSDTVNLLRLVVICKLCGNVSRRTREGWR